MRSLLIPILALGLTACGETASERQARDELERIERERDAAASADVFSGMAPSADSDDASDAAEGQTGSCAGITDAETFVRCLYDGTASGAVRTGQEPDGPAFLSERYWRTVQQMRAAGPGWADMDPLCLCNTSNGLQLRSVRVGARTDDGTAMEVVTRHDGETGHLRVILQRSDEGWRVNAVIAHSG